VLQNIVIPKTQDPKSFTFEPFVSLPIDISSVLATINFDDEAILKRNKVGDVWANGSLTFDLQILKAMRAQEIPKPFLGFCQIPSEPLCQP